MNKKWELFWGIGVVVALMLPISVSAGLLDGTGVGESTNVQTAPALAPAPLAKLTTATRTNYVIGSGSCPGTTCNTSCSTVTFSSAPVKLPGLGKSSLAGCISFEISTAEPNGTGGSCDDSSGTATATGVGGTITLGLGGHICDVPPGALATETVEMNLVYVVTGGTGKFTAASGVGDFTGSLLTTSGFPGTLAISGVLAPH